MTTSARCYGSQLGGTSKYWTTCSALWTAVGEYSAMAWWGLAHSSAIVQSQTLFFPPLSFRGDTPCKENKIGQERRLHNHRNTSVRVVGKNIEGCETYVRQQVLLECIWQNLDQVLCGFSSPIHSSCLCITEKGHQHSNLKKNTQTKRKLIAVAFKSPHFFSSFLKYTAGGATVSRQNIDLDSC